MIVGFQTTEKYSAQNCSRDSALILMLYTFDWLRIMGEVSANQIECSHRYNEGCFKINLFFIIVTHLFSGETSAIIGTAERFMFQIVLASLQWCTTRIKQIYLP